MSNMEAILSKLVDNGAAQTKALSDIAMTMTDLQKKLHAGVTSAASDADEVSDDLSKKERAKALKRMDKDISEPVILGSAEIKEAKRRRALAELEEHPTGIQVRYSWSNVAPVVATAVGVTAAVVITGVAINAGVQWMRGT